MQEIEDIYNKDIDVYIILTYLTLNQLILSSPTANFTGKQYALK